MVGENKRNDTFRNPWNRSSGFLVDRCFDVWKRTIVIWMPIELTVKDRNFANHDRSNSMVETIVTPRSPGINRTCRNLGRTSWSSQRQLTMISGHIRCNYRSSTGYGQRIKWSRRWSSSINPSIGDQRGIRMASRSQFIALLQKKHSGFSDQWRAKCLYPKFDPRICSLECLAKVLWDKWIANRINTRLTIGLEQWRLR